MDFTICTDDNQNNNNAQKTRAKNVLSRMSIKLLFTLRKVFVFSNCHAFSKSHLLKFSCRILFLTSHFLSSFAFLMFFSSPCIIEYIFSVRQTTAGLFHGWRLTTSLLGSRPPKETRCSYHLQGKPGNCGWKTKWYIPFHLNHLRNYRLPVFLFFVTGYFPIDTSTFCDISVLRSYELQH